MRWLEPEWREEAEAWIRERTRVAGPIEQPHVYPWSTVMRVPTADGDLWFKAVPPQHAFEPELGLLLAEAFPDRVTEQLRTRMPELRRADSAPVSIASPLDGRIAMQLIDRLDAARRRWNVLEHPFYRRWECGELRRSELTAYAGEYRHAVVALADAAEAAAPLAGPEHAGEERSHVELWDDFARAVDAAPGPAQLDGTTKCVTAWTAATDPIEALGILYAIEAGQPDVSRTKLDGLVEHYGFQPESTANAYFTLHAERDHEHAAHSRELLELHARPEDTNRVVDAAERALIGNWSLLDGVEALR